MPFTIGRDTPLAFQFRKTGGAKMTMRIAVWRNPQQPDAERVRLLFVGGAQSTVETPDALDGLDPGAYQIVAVSVIEEAVNGTYDYEGSLNGNRFAKRSGDVNTSQGVDVDAVFHRASFTVV